MRVSVCVYSMLSLRDEGIRTKDIYKSFRLCIFSNDSNLRSPQPALCPFSEEYESAQRPRNVHTNSNMRKSRPTRERSFHPPLLLFPSHVRVPPGHERHKPSSDARHSTSVCQVS